MARALLVAEDQLADGDGDAAFLQRQGRDRALLRRPHPEQGAGACATPSSKAPTASPRWRSKRSDRPSPMPRLNLDAAAARPAQPAAADHRLAAVHHQQPEARDRAVQGRHRRLDAGAERAAGRAARRVAGRDHRDAGRARPRPSGAGRRRRSRSTRSCTRATTGSSTTWQLCAKYKVPIVITSLGARTDVNDAVHALGRHRAARHHQQHASRRRRSRRAPTA